MITSPPPIVLASTLLDRRNHDNREGEISDEEDAMNSSGRDLGIRETTRNREASRSGSVSKVAAKRPAVEVKEDASEEEVRNPAEDDETGDKIEDEDDIEEGDEDEASSGSESDDPCDKPLISNLNTPASPKASSTTGGFSLPTPTASIHHPPSIVPLSRSSSHTSPTTPLSPTRASSVSKINSGKSIVFETSEKENQEKHFTPVQDLEKENKENSHVKKKNKKETKKKIGKKTFKLGSKPCLSKISIPIVDGAITMIGEGTAIPTVPTVPLSTAACDLEEKESRERLIENAKQCTQLTDYLFVGGQKVASNLEILQQYQITHVVNCAADVCPNYHAKDLTYYTLHLLDSPDEDMMSVLYDVIDFIEDSRVKGGRILVHCQQGVSRSPAICIGYLMMMRNEGYQVIANLLKQHRSISRPNLNFSCQLIEWRRRTSGHDDRKAYLYRIAPHSNRDTQLVGKWVDKIENKSLDARGAFVLQTPSVRRVYVYVGSACKRPEAYCDAAQKVIRRLQAREYAPEEVEYVFASSPPTGSRHTIAHGSSLHTFWQTIGLGPEGENGLATPFNSTYDKDYGDPSSFALGISAQSGTDTLAPLHSPKKMTDIPPGARFRRRRRSSAGPIMMEFQKGKEKRDSLTLLPKIGATMFRYPEYRQVRIMDRKDLLSAEVYALIRTGASNGSSSSAGIYSALSPSSSFCAVPSSVFVHVWIGQSFTTPEATCDPVAPPNFPTSPRSKSIPVVRPLSTKSVKPRVSVSTSVAPSIASSTGATELGSDTPATATAPDSELPFSPRPPGVSELPFSPRPYGPQAGVIGHTTIEEQDADTDESPAADEALSPKVRGTELPFSPRLGVSAAVAHPSRFIAHGHESSIFSPRGVDLPFSPHPPPPNKKKVKPFLGSSPPLFLQSPRSGQVPPGKAAYASPPSIKRGPINNVFSSKGVGPVVPSTSSTSSTVAASASTSTSTSTSTTSTTVRASGTTVRSSSSTIRSSGSTIRSSGSTVRSTNSNSFSTSISASTTTSTTTSTTSSKFISKSASKSAATAISPIPSTSTSTSASTSTSTSTSSASASTSSTSTSISTSSATQLATTASTTTSIPTPAIPRRLTESKVSTASDEIVSPAPLSPLSPRGVASTKFDWSAIPDEDIEDIDPDENYDNEDSEMDDSTKSTLPGFRVDIGENTAPSIIFDAEEEALSSSSRSDSRYKKKSRLDFVTQVVNALKIILKFKNEDTPFVTIVEEEGKESSSFLQAIYGNSSGVPGVAKSNGTQSASSSMIQITGDSEDVN